MNLFPYDKVRPVQKEMMEQVEYAICNHKHIVVHAPTGVGKTAAVLAPALKLAKKDGLTVFFLTSRHTQHRIVIDTIKSIQREFNVRFTVADVIGKKWMCAQDGAKKLYSSDFFEYCKTIREDNMCSYYNNLKFKGKISPQASVILAEAKDEPLHCEHFVQRCRSERLCPYELSLMLARVSDVIVADYSYVFDPIVKQAFFARLGKELENSIVIVDEGHNLPNRLRDSMSDSLSQFVLDNSIKELKQAKRHELLTKVETLRFGFVAMGNGLSDERTVSKQEFLKLITNIESPALLHDELEDFADTVREEKQRSWCGGLARFIENWLGPEKGFVRYLKATERGLVLHYKALDPAIISRDVIASTHSTVLMSGTLTPTSMFRDLLGFPENTILEEYESPFPHENRLALVVPVTSTRYRSRTTGEYKRIAMVCGAIAEEIPGNIAFFFPSYQLRDDIARFLEGYTSKQLLYEERGMSKSAKQQLLEKFIGLRVKGAALLGIVRGSFGEGIDFPGDWLQGVVVVGLPLAKPNIETQAIIDYFNGLNGKGIEYGYIFPAINLALQSAGRCIRSEHDKGVVILLDERYGFPRYMQYLPKDWHFIATRNFPELIQDFFKNP